LGAKDEITGFTAGDTIELAGISFAGSGGAYGTAGEDTYTVANPGTLTIDSDGRIYTFISAARRQPKVIATTAADIYFLTTIKSGTIHRGRPARRS
jgi:hypothetical protein